MKAVLCFLPWLIAAVVFTAGSHVPRVDAHQSRTICCEVGRQLAENNHDCNAAALNQPKIHGASSGNCEGYMRRCCRKRLYEKQCEIGRLSALSDRSCKNFSLAISEECCMTCRDALSSKTCSAAWLDDDVMLSKVFQSCCEIGQSDLLKNTMSLDGPQEQHPYTETPECPKGYVYDKKASLCKDIDECNLKESVCPGESRCVNKEGGFDCIKSRLQRAESIPDCGAGFAYSRHLQECVDIDECASGSHSCKKTQACLNLEGTFTCKRLTRSDCGAGYSFKAGLGCVDENECASTNACTPEETCLNRGGHYMCVPACEIGFQIDPMSVECIDIDECLTGTHNCGDTEECFNTEGSFTCRASNFVESCKTGFQRSANGDCKDIDECTRNSHNCSETQECINLEGGFVCIERCDKGFSLNSAGRCEDINECVTSSPCHEFSEICRNTKGGYVCDCKKGFEKTGSICTDIDECKRFWKPCGDQAICGNTDGSFSCFANCGEGYHHVNGTCIDRNECEEFDMPCLRGQQCLNVPGTYKCVDKDCELLGKVRSADGTCLIRRTCPLGFRHDLGMDICVDRNECAEMFPSACPANSFCENTIGSFECIPMIVHCAEGMRRTFDGTRCENIDECSEGLHNCDLDSEQCLDRTGSFDCFCRVGFERDHTGKCVSSEALLCPLGFRRSHFDGRCQDINECDNPGVCEHECKNTIGSYECKCKPGFEPDKRNKAKCIDINECKRVGICLGLCENTHGSYICTCPKGYEMKSNACKDVDECSSPKGHVCKTSETCLNIGGGFRCLSYDCPTNYTKDGANAMRCIRNQACLNQTHCSLDPDLIVFNHIPLSRSNSKRPLSVRISGQSNVFADFSLHVSKVIPYKTGLAGATDDNFLLKTKHTAAKVLVRKRISGPQDVHMTLKAKLYNLRRGPPEGRELFKIIEWRIVLYVPGYDF